MCSVPMYFFQRAHFSASTTKQGRRPGLRPFMARGSGSGVFHDSEARYFASEPRIN